MSFPSHASPPVIHALLLDKLLRSPGQPVTIHALSQATGLSIPAVHEELTRLNAAGCELESHPHQGVTLHRTGAGSWTDYLQWRLGPHRPIVVFSRTASTQDAAKRQLGFHGPAAHSCAVIADEQYAGRGRLGRTWAAPPGSAVTMSLVHVAATSNTGQPSPLSVDHLIFATAVAVAQGIEAAVDHKLETRIKWPNDILIDGQKIAGILVETVTLTGGRPAAVIGVGINVGSTPDLSVIDTHRGPRTATSLFDQGQRVDRLRVMGEVLTAMDHALTLEDPSPLVEQWRHRSVLQAQSISFQTPEGIVTGRVMDIDPHEGLIVRSDSGAILHLPAATTSVM